MSTVVTKVTGKLITRDERDLGLGSERPVGECRE